MKKIYFFIIFGLVLPPLSWLLLVHDIGIPGIVPFCIIIGLYPVVVTAFSFVNENYFVIATVVTLSVFANTALLYLVGKIWRNRHKSIKNKIILLFFALLYAYYIFVQVTF